MSRENHFWGVPRIVTELKLLGFEVSESTAHRYNTSRSHESLEGYSPEPRIVDIGDDPILSTEYLGGLHHRYYRQTS